MDTVVASVCPRNNRVLIPTRSCRPTKYNENVFLQTTYRGRIRESTRDPRMENDPAVIAPRPTRGNGNRGGDGASDECLMRRSDTILTASYVDDAMFCTDDSYPRFCRIEARSRSSFGKIFEFYCY